MARIARHGSLRTKVYNQLLENILQERYRRGTVLTEALITQKMNVSRTPVREALCQLELDGLVVTTPNKSYIVQGFDEKDILDLYEVRSKMEALAAERAALEMSDEECADFKAAYEQEVRNTINNNEVAALENLDNSFHEFIFNGSKSKILQNILNSINNFTRYARTVSLGNPGRAQKVIEEHERIMQAIIDHNGELAYQLMKDHIMHASASFRTINKNRRKANE